MKRMAKVVRIFLPTATTSFWMLIALSRTSCVLLFFDSRSVTKFCILFQYNSFSVFIFCILFLYAFSVCFFCVFKMCASRNVTECVYKNGEQEYKSFQFNTCISIYIHIPVYPYICISVYSYIHISCNCSPKGIRGCLWLKRGHQRFVDDWISDSIVV